MSGADIPHAFSRPEHNLRLDNFENHTAFPSPSPGTQKLERILQNNGLKIALRGSNTLASCLNSGKDRTFVEQQSGVYKIPCTYGSSYVGGTNQNLKMRLLQNHNSISSSLKQNAKPEDFTSALWGHIYNYPNNFI